LLLRLEGPDDSRVAAGLPDGVGERILTDPACGKFPTTRYRVVRSFHDGGYGDPDHEGGWQHRPDMSWTAG
jgi:hypothetical protein